MSVRSLYRSGLCGRSNDRTSSPVASSLPDRRHRFRVTRLRSVVQWTLQAVARKYTLPPTNIVRASKGLRGKPKIRSLKMCGGAGVEVYYEPDVKAYAKVYKPSKKQVRSAACKLRTLASRGRAVHWVPVKSEDGGALCGKVGDWSAPLKSSARRRVCGRYHLKKR